MSDGNECTETFDRSVRGTCARPELSVGAQLKRTFMGLTVVPLTIIFFIYLGCAIASGDIVASRSEDSLKTTVKSSMLAAARMSGEVIEKKLDNLEGVVRLIEQAMLDRVQGYSPTNDAAARAELWADANAPFAFADVTTGATANGYPVAIGPSLLDIEFGWGAGSEAEVAAATGDASASASARWAYKTTSSLGASSVIFKGSCDVGTSSGEPWSNYDVAGCDAAANRPNDEQAVLLNKTAHLDLFFKPLYEAYADIQLLGVYFYAGGDGATRLYPGLFPVPIGCYEPCAANVADYTCQTEPGAAVVCGRDYNPAQRPWFWSALAAAENDEIVHAGPYSTAFYPDADSRENYGSQDKLWVISLMRGVLDRETKAVVGAISLDIEISGMQTIIDEAKLGTSGTASLVSWSTGDIVAADCFSSSDSELVKFEDCQTNRYKFSQKIWEELSYTDEGIENRDILLEEGGNFITRAFIPSTGMPKYVVVLTLAENEIMQPVKEMQRDIGASLDSAILTTFFLTLAVILVVTTLVFAMARHLTSPLKYMTKLANRIVGNAAGDLGAGVSASQISKFGREDEVGELVFQFGTMISGLGGKSAAASVAAEKTADQLDNAAYCRERPFSSKLPKSAAFFGGVEPVQSKGPVRGKLVKTKSYYEQLVGE